VHAAKFLGLKSPVPYKFRKFIPQNLKYGMNFAYGGTGVFDTSSKNPNMTIQIDFFKQLIKENVYTASDLTRSVALVSVAGNDYNFYLARNGSLQVSYFHHYTYTHTHMVLFFPSAQLCYLLSFTRMLTSYIFIFNDVKSSSY